MQSFSVLGLDRISPRRSAARRASVRCFRALPSLALLCWVLMDFPSAQAQQVQTNSLLEAASSAQDALDDRVRNLNRELEAIFACDDTKIRQFEKSFESMIVDVATKWDTYYSDYKTRVQS